MNPHDRIRQRLESMPSPEPPQDLLDRIQAEIPSEFPAAEPVNRVSARWWQVAAALVLFVGGGWLAWTWSRDPLAPELGVSMTREATGPVSLPSHNETAVAPTTATAAETEGRAAEDRSDLYAKSRSFEEPGVAPAPAPQPSPVRTGAATPAPDDEGRGLPAPPPPSSVGPDSRGAVAQRAVRDEARPAPPRPQASAPMEFEAQQETKLQAEASSKDPASTAKRELDAARNKSVGLVAGGAVAEAITVTSAAPVAPPSTGGTAEPNDQPYGDVFFRTYGTNPFVDTEDDRLSTFGLDVDSGSYTVARRYLRDGNLPPGEAIRVEEFLNYFGYDDPAPSRGDFALSAEGGPWPWQRGERYYGVRFGIRAREVTAAQRKPATLIFTIDVSGSMQRETRLELVKRALRLLVGQLDRSDRIGLVVYGSRGEVLLEPTSDHDLILETIERLQPGGSTNAEEGLTLAYDLANRWFRPNGINRVILCSDGVANVGRTGPDSILARIGTAARRGIELTTVGFGMGNYNDVLMEQLANKGNGQYAYVDDLAEARRVFVENLTGTLQTIARDAKAQVEFDPRVVSRYRLLGYENRDVADDRFRDDTVDAGEIGAGHSVTALYEIKLQPGARPNDVVGVLRLRYADVDGGDRVVELEETVRVRDLAPRFESAPRSFRKAALVATFAEMLKGSYWTKDIEPRELVRRIGQLADQWRDPQLAELEDLARRAASMLPDERRWPEE